MNIDWKDMTPRLRLSKKRQALVTEYMPLARMLARFFVQARPAWQKAALIPDLEGDGFLALCKAARTYDPARLPYPKAYFARAILNSMLKSIKKTTRQPGLEKISLQEASDLMPVFDHPDYLKLAVEDLPEDEQDLAKDRFQKGDTLRTISQHHQISLRLASVRSRELATKIAAALDIRLSPLARDTERPSGGSSRENPFAAPASRRRRGEGPKR
jgi:RNA polymerase sigma factor (sigma-70 family)